jgi:GNAT superfamily N-acetyltransferase
MLGSLEGYVSDVFVSPSAGGLGVGKALVERVIDEGKRRGCMRLMLTNGKEKLSYKTGFYKKLGWTERPSVANFVYYYQEPWS